MVAGIVAELHFDGPNPPVTAHCITAATTVAAAFAETARRRADRAFLRVLPETARAYGIVAGTITYGDMATDVARLRAAYNNFAAELTERRDGIRLVEAT